MHSKNCVYMDISWYMCENIHIILYIYMNVYILCIYLKVFDCVLDHADVVEQSCPS